MRSILRIGILGVAAAWLLSTCGLSQQTTGESPVPKLIVSLFPAQGVVPLGSVDEPAPAQRSPRPRIGDTPPDAVYVFQILARDREDPRRGLAYAQGFVRPGQTKEIRGGTRDAQVRGSVHLTSLGVANYEAELWMAGRLVSSTGAALNFNPDFPTSRAR